MFNAQGEIHSKLAKKYSLDKNIIVQICNHPFIFAKERMVKPDDEKSFMFPYFAKIRLKKRYKGIKYKVDGEYRRAEMLNKKRRKSI